MSASAARGRVSRILASRIRAGSLLLGAIGVLGTGCGGSQGPVAGDEFRDMTADNIIFDMRYYVTAEGIRQALLLSDTAYVYEDDGRIELRGVHLTVYGEAGEEAGVLTSEEGELNTLTDAMVARGSVVLVSHEDGSRTETDELHYRPEENRVWSDTPTTRYVDGSVLRGEGFTADAQLRNLQLRQPRGDAPGVQIDF